MTDNREAENQEAKNLYKALVKISPEAVTISDLEGRISEVSQKTLELHGFKRAEEVLGKNAFELIAQEDHEKAKKNLEKTLKEGTIRNVKYTFVRKGGSHFIAELNASVIKDIHGKATAFIATTRNITERKNIEDELRKSEEIFRDLFENANDLIQSIDVNGRFIYVNKKWLETLGYSEEEVKNLKLTDILRNDQISHCMRLFKEVCSGKSVDKVETIFVTKHGHEIYVEGNANARFKHGKFIATRGIFRDITKRKKAEEEIKKRSEELEKLSKFGVDRELKMVELKNKIKKLELLLQKHGIKPDKSGERND